jgi:hypothetical protein
MFVISSPATNLRRIERQRGAAIRGGTLYGFVMSFWADFWTLNFIVAGGAFALIALVVAVRGVADLRAMLAALRDEQR